MADAAATPAMPATAVSTILPYIGPECILLTHTSSYLSLQDVTACLQAMPKDTAIVPSRQHIEEIIRRSTPHPLVAISGDMVQWRDQKDKSAAALTLTEIGSLRFLINRIPANLQSQNNPLHIGIRNPLRIPPHTEPFDMTATRTGCVCRFRARRSTGKGPQQGQEQGQGQGQGPGHLVDLVECVGDGVVEGPKKVQGIGLGGVSGSGNNNTAIVDEGKEVSVDNQVSVQMDMLCRDCSKPNCDLVVLDGKCKVCEGATQACEQHLKTCQACASMCQQVHCCA